MSKCILSILIFTAGIHFSLQGQTLVSGEGVEKDSLRSEQLIIVVSDKWNAMKARLFCYEKIKGEWLLEFSFDAVLGKNGMALGEGIRQLGIHDAPQKKEGDLRSPAGFFMLGPAFGYAVKKQADWIRLSYLQASDTLFCIDDPNSTYYNEILNADSVPTDWKSYEVMHRMDIDYKWGIFVQHNSHPVKKEKGSCIFLHIWDSENEGTAGCTAMEENNILKILHWIQAKKNPLLIQMPLTEYQHLRDDFHLPVLRMD